MSAISNIYAREILDSRGNPTVQVEVFTELGGFGLANSPSGASTGKLEAHELRDKGTKYAKNWFGGKGVQTAVNNVNNIIAPELIGMEVSEQRMIDQIMINKDGTKNKSKLGANAILAVSLAVAKAAASELDLPLYKYIGGTNARTMPVPMMNIINGGEHASNTLDIQEFMIVPIGAQSFKESVQMANKVFHTLFGLLKDNEMSTLVGDEGGFAPNFRSHEEALSFMVKAITDAGYKAATSGKGSIAIALDPAASEFYNGKKYVFKKLKKAITEKWPGFTTKKTQSEKLEFTSEEMAKYYQKLIKKFPIISIEDGFAESDWKGFKYFNDLVGTSLQNMGDDITVTNPAIISYAVKENSMNSVLVKLNQIGTLSETLDAIELIHKSSMTAVVSHRSGETTDTTIADLAVATNTGMIKSGSVSRTDRVAKYNRLIAIEEELGSTAVYLGEKAFFNLKRNVMSAKKPSLAGTKKHESKI